MKKYKYFDSINFFLWTNEYHSMKIGSEISIDIGPWKKLSGNICDKYNLEHCIKKVIWKISI